MADLAHGDAVGDGGRGGDLEAVTGVERQPHGRQGGRLHADDANGRAPRLHRERDPADEAAAADRNQQGLHVRHLGEELEAERALARDHTGIVEGMDEHVVTRIPQRTRVRVGLVEVGAVLDDVGAVPARRRHLDERGGVGHHDGGRDRQPRRVEGDGEPMIAGAGGDDAAGALIRRELHQQIGGAALLEGARHLQVLQLDEHTRAAQLG
jgi:hypothetical protein